MQSSASALTRVVTDPVRVMIVDDSVVVRGLVGRWIDEDPELAVVATHRTGRNAVDDILRSEPDVVVLDVEMPDMDGLTALPLLLRKKPDVRIVMASTLTQRNAEISLKALSLGASECVAKPEAKRGAITSSDFRRELVEKIRHLGNSGKEKRALRKPMSTQRKIAPSTASAQARSPVSPTTARARQPATTARPMAGASTFCEGEETFDLRPASIVAPRVLLIGSSTGGPQALTKLLGHLGPKLSHLPVLIAQHMPPTFTAILAEHMQKASGLDAAEGEDSEPILPGRIYVAPGGKHMMIGRIDDRPVVRLDDGPQINFCKPAVDPMFQSGAKVFGPGTLAVILTGMGADGAKGTDAIADAGGTIVAQDKASSVVWGMPHAAAMTGNCSSILPLDRIGPSVERIIGGVRK